MSLLPTILLRAVRHPWRVAIVDDRRSYTYGRLAMGAFVLAHEIERRTRRPNVGFLLPTSGGPPAALLGAWLAGRTAVPLNYLLAPEELDQVIRHSEIDTLLTIGPMLEFLGGPSAIPAGISVVKLEDLRPPRLPPLRWPPLHRDDAPAAILYTSGTSGRPKGVVLTHANLESNVRAAIQHAGLRRADTFLGVLPQFHSFGLTALTLAPLALGSKVVYTARFIPHRLVELMRQHRPDVFLAVPSMYAALLSVKDATAEDFASVRLPISGGEPLPGAVADEYERRLNLRLLEGYGLTETSPVVSWCAPGQYRRGSVGRPLPGVVVGIADAAGRWLGTGQEGEVLVAGPNIMAGYYRDPSLTREVIAARPDPAGRPRRFLRTGDMGRLDGDGYLYITGRMKDLIIVGGLNVFPREIEEVLNRHPAVKESAVIGQPDGLRGEVPLAFVEMQPGQDCDDTVLRSWCREHLASYKVPRHIRKIESLPRGPTGKVIKRKLPGRRHPIP